jgi:Uma2 family endonuclease
MAAPALTPRVTYAAYLAFERAADARHAFHDGEIYAMAGGTPAHSVLGANATRALGVALAQHACTAASSDQRIYISQDHSAYADAAVICPPLARPPEDPDALTNPTLLLEVTSPTSATWDRDGKFALYRTLPSLRHYLVVAHEAWQVDHFERLPDGSWRMTSHGPGDSVEIGSLGIRLSVDDLYAKVEAFGGPARDARPRPVSYPGPGRGTRTVSG